MRFTTRILLPDAELILFGARIFGAVLGFAAAAPCIWSITLTMSIMGWFKAGPVLAATLRPPAKRTMPQ